MENDSALRPTGQTYAITANVAAPTPVQVASPLAGDVSYYVVNTGAVPIFIGYGATAAAATANSVTPTAGNPQNCAVVGAGAAKTFTLTPSLFFTATASASSVFYITPGQGI